MPGMYVLTNLTVNYPISFPNGPLNVYTTPSNVDSVGFITTSSEAIGISSYVLVAGSETANRTIMFRYIAIGY